MTALCPGGGTSAPKAGIAEFVTVSAGAIALAMERYGAQQLRFLIPLLGLAPLEMAAFCGTDPPALPTFTSDEIFSLLRIGLDADYFSGLSKARDLVSRMLWYDFCECTTPSATPFVPPTLPTDTPVFVTPPPATIVPCKTVGPTSPLSIGPSTSYAIGGIDYLGLNVTMVRIIQTATASGSNTGYELRVDQYHQNPTTVHDTQLSYTNFAPGVTRSFRPDPLSTAFICQIGAGSTVGSYTNVTTTFEVYCDGQVPGGTQQPCCPPDAATQNSLDLILKMVTLIQRQAAPFGYVSGPAHTALTGHGSFAVHGLIGVAVDVTTLPANYGRAVGSPEELFGIGFVTLGTADGYELSHRITSDGALFIPPGAGLYTALGYTLSPGVEVTITELMREP